MKATSAYAREFIDSTNSSGTPSSFFEALSTWHERCDAHTLPRSGLYVFVVLEISTHRLFHWNVTEHPTTEWTAQQFRNISAGDRPHRFVVHDRDAVCSCAVDTVLRSMNLRVLNMPPRVPQANAFCERLIGTTRRECLDHVIALNERHLRRILTEWVSHYNRGRPHSSLGPGIPEPSGLPVAAAPSESHYLPHGCRVAVTPMLGGLHHEYRLASSRRDFLRSTTVLRESQADKEKFVRTSMLRLQQQQMLLRARSLVDHQPDRGRSRRARGHQIRAFAPSVESCVQSARVTGRTPSAGRAEPT